MKFRLKKLNTLGLSHLVLPVLAVLVIGSIGTYITVKSRSHAATVSPSFCTANGLFYNPNTGKCIGVSQFAYHTPFFVRFFQLTNMPKTLSHDYVGFWGCKHSGNIYLGISPFSNPVYPITLSYSSTGIDGSYKQVAKAYSSSSFFYKNFSYSSSKLFLATNLDNTPGGGTFAVSNVNACF